MSESQIEFHQLEMLDIKRWIGDAEYKPLTEDQESLLDVMCQFKEPETSPVAAALNVVIRHADQIHSLLDEVSGLNAQLREIAAIVRTALGEPREP